MSAALDGQRVVQAISANINENSAE